jgi:hypothetical protein
MPPVSKTAASKATASAVAFDPYAEWLGIAAHERPVDHYRLLGLPRFENDPTRIQGAADHWMATVRKQQIGKRATYTQQLLNELSSAKLCLLNPQSKADYDTRLIESTRKQLGISPKDEAEFRLKNDSLWMHGASLPKIIVEADDEEPGELPWVTMIVMFTGFAMAAIIVWAVVYTRMSAQQTATEEAKNPPRVVVIEKAAVPIPETPLAPNELQQDAAGNLTFVFDKATLVGGAAIVDSPQGQVISQLQTPDDCAQWTFRGVSAGYFLVEVEYLPLSGPNKGKVEIEIVAADTEPQKRTFSLRQNQVDEDAADASTTRQKATETPIVDRYSLMIKKKGTCTMTLRPAEALSGEGLRVKSVTIRANRLKPAEPTP